MPLPGLLYFRCGLFLLEASKLSVLPTQQMHKLLSSALFRWQSQGFCHKNVSPCDSDTAGQDTDDDWSLQEHK